MLFAIVMGILTILIFLFINKENPHPVQGIYRLPGKWYYMKLSVAYVILRAKKIIATWQAGDQPDTHADSRTAWEKIECRWPVSSTDKVTDNVYFNVASPNGFHLMIGNIQDFQTSHSVVVMKVPGIGVLKTQTVDTISSEGIDAAFDNGVHKMHITLIEPMRLWTVRYHGIMTLLDSPETSYQVTVNVRWDSFMPHFDFTSDMDPFSVAAGMALEPWSKEYFNNIKRFDLRHYQQPGDIIGHVTIDGKEFKLNMNGVRGHSCTKQEVWHPFHRYALHFITLENGNMISVGVVCLPGIFSRLEVGYVYSCGKLYPVKSCDLQLHKHSGRGTPPSDYGFSFTAGGKTYQVQVEVKDSTDLSERKGIDERVVENFNEFTVDDVHGWGTAEWRYFTTLSRWSVNKAMN